MSAPAFILPSPEQLAKGIEKLSPEKQRKLSTALKVLKDAGRPLPDTYYQDKPVEWAVSVLGIPRSSIVWSDSPEYAGHTWDGTPDPLVAVAEGLAQGKNVGVESAVGTGKTYQNAWLALWFHACFENSLVVTTAPIQDQLTLQLWARINDHWPAFKKAYPKAETVQLRVRQKDGSASWVIVGYACGVDASSASAIRAQGFHAPHMLVITEETPGIDPAIMTALRNTATGEHNLQLSVGNPDNQLDALHQFSTKPDVVHVRISALDHPNVVTGREVVPGACSRKSIRAIEADYGPDSPMYNSRARGISPSESAQALVKLEWIREAQKKYKNGSYRSGKKAKGVDVANSVNGDKGAIADGVGACLLGVREFPCPNSNHLGEDVYAEAQLDGTALENIGVDPVGVGAGCINVLRDKPGGYAVQSLNGALSPIPFTARSDTGESYEWAVDFNYFNNLRSQMHWQFREDARLGRLALPNTPEFEAAVRELINTQYTTQNGKTVIESKEQEKKRLGGKSPNLKDAIIYWNWVRPRLPLPSQDVQESGEGKDMTVFAPLEEALSHDFDGVGAW